MMQDYEFLELFLIVCSKMGLRMKIRELLSTYEPINQLEYE
jgi:hypothetical protein